MLRFVVVACLSLAGCDAPSAAPVPTPSPTASTVALTEDQKAELDACERAYVNRAISPDMLGHASVACHRAYLDLPIDSLVAQYAKAMKDAAEAGFEPDEVERKRLEAKVDVLRYES